MFNLNNLFSKWNDLKGQNSLTYRRISTLIQDKGTSLKDQKEICDTFCNSYKMNIIEEFEEKASAMKGGKRQEFNKMVQMLKEGKAKVLVCAFPDRLTRNLTDAETILELIEDYGITVVFVVPNRIMQSPLDPADVLIFLLEIIFANYRVRLDRQRCNAGIVAKNKSGFRSTQTTYGYMNDSELGKAVIMESRAKFVRKAFELYATGNYSVHEVANELFEQGFEYERRPDKKIPTQSLNSMLRNLFYTGKYRIKQEDKPIIGTHEAIISDELFEKVQNLLKSNPKSPRKHNLLYSRLLTCANCGHYMTGDVKVKPNGNKYVYYRCMNPKCKEKVSVSEVSIDDVVNTYLKKLRLELIPEDIIADGLKNEISSMSQNLSTLKRNISRKYHSEQCVMEKAAKNGITDEKYINDKMSAIQEKYGDLNMQILATEKQIETVKSKVTETFKKRLYDVYTGFDTPTKRKVLELVANIFNYGEDRLNMTFESAFCKIKRR
ncbi:resolvase family site-specific recombinase [Fusobacterium sp. CAG:439]|nr:resolvase family site-specific recombinase [Fusobacterium sp. CAG:439]